MTYNGLNGGFHRGPRLRTEPPDADCPVLRTKPSTTKLPLCHAGAEDLLKGVQSLVKTRRILTEASIYLGKKPDVTQDL